MSITEAFYKQIILRKNKASALRTAKLTYISSSQKKRKAHPFYWANYVPVGDMEAILK